LIKKEPLHKNNGSFFYLKSFVFKNNKHYFCFQAYT